MSRTGEECRGTGFSVGRGSWRMLELTAGEDAERQVYGRNKADRRG